MKTEDSITEIQEVLLKVALRIAKRGEGALFVVGDVDFNPLVDQTVPSFKIIDNPKLLESLALMDGAVVVGKDGVMKAYGVLVKTTRTLKNFGTRHSAAVSASKNDNLVVLISEEDRKVRILKDEKMIMEIDPLQKGVEKSVSKIIQVLEGVGAGTIGAIGTSLLAPSLGVTLLPGIILFGSAYYIGKKLTKLFKNSHRDF